MKNREEYEEDIEKRIENDQKKRQKQVLILTPQKIDSYLIEIVEFR